MAKLSEIFGNTINKKGILKVDIELDNGTSRKSGDIVTVLYQNSDGEYHVEDTLNTDGFSCTVSNHEIDII